jgi:hypothetical protein
MNLSSITTRMLQFLIVAGAVTLHAQMLVLPSADGEGVNRGQPFDRNVKDPAVYAGRVYFIWGAREPHATPPAVASKYLPYSRDLDRTHTLAWYRENHPEWVEYEADHVTPAYGFIYARGNAMSIDISNPDVREWYWQSFVQPAIDAGYRVIAFDNVDLQNGEKREGHFDGRGEWVQQFSGSRIDDAYLFAVLDWMQYLGARLHKGGIGMAANITYPLGRPQLEPSMRRLIGMVDIWGDEQGFTHHDAAEVNDEKWQRKFDFVRSVEAQTIHWAVNELASKHLAEASQTQIDWAVANYYLYREKNSLLTVCGAQEYGVYLDTPAMHVDLGHPLSPPVREDNGVWTRRYSAGLVGVNPSSRHSAIMRLPLGNWVDSNGGKHAGQLELPAVSGVMLVQK